MSQVCCGKLALIDSAKMTANGLLGQRGKDWVKQYFITTNQIGSNNVQNNNVQPN